MGENLKACCWELFRGPQACMPSAPTPSFSLAPSTGLDIGHGKLLWMAPYLLPLEQQI